MPGVVAAASVRRFDTGSPSTASGAPVIRLTYAANAAITACDHFTPWVRANSSIRFLSPVSAHQVSLSATPVGAMDVPVKPGTCSMSANSPSQ